MCALVLRATATAPLHRYVEIRLSPWVDESANVYVQNIMAMRGGNELNGFSAVQV